MKKTLIIVSAVVAGAISGYSQGTVLYRDGQTDATFTIFAPQTATPSVEVTGNQGGQTGVAADLYDNNGTDGNYAGGPTVTPGSTNLTGTITTGGLTVYTGGAIGNTATANPTSAGAYSYNNGSDYTVELYAAPGLNDAFSALQPVTGYAATIKTSGTKAGQMGTASPSPDPGIPSTSSGSATIALVAWYNGGGATSYAAALAAGVPTGVSPLDNDTFLGGVGGPPASTPVDLQGIESFSLVLPPVVTPEPSTIALGVIGASTLLFRRRNKK